MTSTEGGGRRGSENSVNSIVLFVGSIDIFVDGGSVKPHLRMF